MRVAGWGAWIALVTLAFVQPLTTLIILAAQSNLNSYILLVPFVAARLLLIQQRPASTGYRSSPGGTIMLAATGALALVCAYEMRARVSVNDHAGLTTLAYVAFVAAGGYLFLGSRWMTAAAFPVYFLLFMVPLPDAAVDSLETASVLGSAEVAAWFFNMTRTPLLRDGTLFALPGILIRVAQECSGIRSSWALLITSLLASYLFLKGPWRRLVLVGFVIPLAIARNAFRILVIGLLCVHIGPEMINSIIHRRGGPLFFALSLVPLSLVLWALRRQEHGQLSIYNSQSTRSSTSLPFD